ncbi:MATE family efflux transporter [Halanaerobium praevalens]|uniref:Probable multidrug resistance protein NorM n=1 Tax=Halanaerobium praevalens (strain ATCC 33744 / DSM 2228 / GSL) TaxID=572479 RepID=E3DMY0_HALPG|nr:MATE family efflux transporter [Halanaerobium praevalens]ADO77469.1 MATE efflux family protein [Halanaerobium praevalens DSM 2228]
MVDDNKAIINENSSTKKVIFKLAWPVIAEQSLATVTQIVDMMMVGRLGASSVAAIGLTMQPVFFSTALASALGVGTTALVSRFTGSNQNKKAASVLQQSILMSLIFSVFFAFIFYLSAPKLLIFMGGEAEVIKLGTGYLRMISPGFIFMVLAFIVTAALRGAGETKTPMKVNILVNILNIFGNYLFIFGNFGFPKLGVNGAALATTLSRSLGGIILLTLTFTNYSVLKMKIEGFFRFDLNLIKRVLKVGIPTAMEESVRRLAQLLFIRVIASLGTTAFAAHQISLNAESISYMPGFGIAVAATTIVGQNLGAKNPEGAEKGTFEAWKIGSLIMGFMALILLIFPEQLVKLYTTDPEIITKASLNLRIIALAQIPMGTQFIFAGALRGAGDTKAVFYSTAISTWIFRLLLGYILVHPLGLGLFGAWSAMVIDWIVRGSYVIYRFKKGNWKLINI